MNIKNKKKALHMNKLRHSYKPPPPTVSRSILLITSVSNSSNAGQIDPNTKAGLKLNCKSARFTNDVISLEKY